MGKKLKCLLKDINLEFEPHYLIAGLEKASFKDFSILREKSKRFHKFGFLQLQYEVFSPFHPDQPAAFSGIELVKQYIKDEINAQP